MGGDSFNPYVYPSIIQTARDLTTLLLSIASNYLGLEATLQESNLALLWFAPQMKLLLNALIQFKATILNDSGYKN